MLLCKARPKESEGALQSLRNDIYSYSFCKENESLVLHVTGFEPVASQWRQIMSLLLSTTQPYMLQVFNILIIK